MKKLYITTKKCGICHTQYEVSTLKGAPVDCPVCREKSKPLPSATIKEEKVSVLVSSPLTSVKIDVPVQVNEEEKKVKGENTVPEWDNKMSKTKLLEILVKSGWDKDEAESFSKREIIEKLELSSRVSRFG